MSVSKLNVYLLTKFLFLIVGSAVAVLGLLLPSHSAFAYTLYENTDNSSYITSTTSGSFNYIYTRVGSFFTGSQNFNLGGSVIDYTIRTNTCSGFNMDIIFASSTITSGFGDYSYGNLDDDVGNHTFTFSTSSLNTLTSNTTYYVYMPTYCGASSQTREIFSNSLRTNFYGSIESTSTVPLLDFNTQYVTRFNNVTFGSATTTVNISTTFFISSTEASSTNADVNATQIRYRYAKVPSTDINTFTDSITDSITPTWGSGTSSVSLTLDNSSVYDFTVGFGNAGTAISGIVPFPLAYVYFRVTTNASGGIATTSVIENYNAVNGQVRNYQNCGLTEISGCIVNAGIYLFTPSSESINQFKTVSDSFSGRIPFVYAYQIPDLVNTMLDSSSVNTMTVSASTSIGTITFLSASQINAIPLAGTMRTMMSYVLWIMLAFTLYRMGKNLFAPKQETV